MTNKNLTHCPEGNVQTSRCAALASRETGMPVWRASVRMALVSAAGVVAAGLIAMGLGG